MHFFGDDGARSEKGKKIFPSAETPYTSPAGPDMTEDARPSMSSGGPASIETALPGLRGYSAN